MLSSGLFVEFDRHHLRGHATPFALTNYYRKAPREANMTLKISRRHFLSTSATAAAAAYFTPHSLFAQAAATAPVQAPVDRIAAMRAAGATAKITTHTLRGNVSVLQGSGGN